MLMLKRKVGEVIWIGDARIVVHRLDKKSVQIGVDAPQDIRVLRGEIRDQIEHGVPFSFQPVQVPNGSDS